MLHMGLLGEANRHLLVLVAHMDCQLAAAGSRNRGGSVRWADPAEQVGLNILRGCNLERENMWGLVEEGRRL